MARFNPETYPDRQSFDAHARALRRAELARLAGLIRERLALALRRARGLVARGADSVAEASMARSPRRRVQ